jgi:hypothetical protein
MVPGEKVRRGKIVLVPIPVKAVPGRSQRRAETDFPSVTTSLQ